MTWFSEVVRDDDDAVGNFCEVEADDYDHRAAVRWNALRRPEPVLPPAKAPAVLPTYEDRLVRLLRQSRRLVACPQCGAPAGEPCQAGSYRGITGIPRAPHRRRQLDPDIASQEVAALRALVFGDKP